MTMIVNKSGRTLKMGGKTVAPLEMADVEGKNLKDHLFVRSGLVEFSGASSMPKRGRPRKAEPEPETQPESSPEDGASE